MLLAAFGGTAAYLLWMSLPWPLIHDAPILHYIAWRIAHGAVPYRDLFDMNQPGAYLIHLAVLRVFGDGDVGWRIFDLTGLALGAAAIASYAAPWGVVAAVGGAVGFVLYHLADGAWQAGQRDFLLCPLLVIAAGGVAAWDGTGSRSAFDARDDSTIRTSRKLALALSGLALGAAITIKPHTALLAVMLSVVVAIVAGRRRRLVSLVIYLGPLVLPPLVVLAWLAKLGALGAWREIVFGYLIPLYARLGQPQWAFYRWYVWIPIGLTVALSIASALWHRRFTLRHGVALLGLAYGLIHFFGQGKGWEYHLYPLAVFAMLLLFSEVDIVLRHRRDLGFAIPLVAALAVTVVLLGQKGAEAANAEWIWDKERVVRWITWDIGPRLAPTDTVQVFDTAEGGIHALLRLHTVQPTRFLYDFHFFHDTDQPLIQRLSSELVRDLTARPPRFVVILERGWPSGRLERIQRIPELTRWLEGAYTLYQRRGGYVIFEKRRGS